MNRKSEIVRLISRDCSADTAQQIITLLMAMDYELEDPNGEQANDPEFENKHPRGAGGKFQSKGSPSEYNTQPSFRSHIARPTAQKAKTKSTNAVKSVESQIAQLESGKLKATGKVIANLEKTLREFEGKAKAKTKNVKTNPSSTFTAKKSDYVKLGQPTQNATVSVKQATPEGKKWNREHGFNENMTEVVEQRGTGGTRTVYGTAPKDNVTKAEGKKKVSINKPVGSNRRKEQA